MSRNVLRVAFAYASGSTGRNTALVTPSPRAVVCVTALFELARWCQLRLDFKEDPEPCPKAIPDPPCPPAPAGHQQPPAWGQLNLSVRQALILALTRMLQPHRPDADPRGEQEVRDESQ